jgi:hypothetical protein
MSPLTRYTFFFLINKTLSYRQDLLNTSNPSQNIFLPQLCISGFLMSCMGPTLLAKRKVNLEYENPFGLHKRLDISLVLRLELELLLFYLYIYIFCFGMICGILMALYFKHLAMGLYMMQRVILRLRLKPCLKRSSGFGGLRGLSNLLIFKASLV